MRRSLARSGARGGSAPGRRTYDERRGAEEQQADDPADVDRRAELELAVEAADEERRRR